jgi:hypothetical protein
MKTSTAYTYIAFGEYHGQQHIYDGHDSERATGTAEEVIAFLEETKLKIPAAEESLHWAGGNGTWYSGDEARAVIDGEITALRDGSHPCFRADE